MRTDVRFSGFGGQGVITMGKILGRAAVLHDHRHAILTEDYGPEKTGGWSRADVAVSHEEIGYPIVEAVDILVALSQDGYERYGASLKPTGLAFFDAGLVRPAPAWNRPTAMVPARAVATELGARVVTNIVMLGALVERTHIVTPEAARKAVLEAAPRGKEDLNGQAFDRGRALAEAGA